MRIKLLFMLLALLGATSAFADDTNLMAGWNEGGYGQNKDKTPKDAGWVCTDANIKWAKVVTSISYDACYRDFTNPNNRWFTHGGNSAVFAYPVTLEANTTYKFSGLCGNMNHEVTTIFGFNTQRDGGDCPRTTA
jgi:hypothetical protein